MNDSNIDVGTRQSVVAMVREGGQLKAIELQSKGESVEILWTRSAETADTDWASFASKCGLSAEPSTETEPAGRKDVVVGFSSAGTVFHRASVPPVEKEEIESIVQLQAETRLPLPADQTELAWRAAPPQNGQIDVTMVVARKELLQRFADDVRGLDPAKILLHCEAIVKAWATVFSEHAQKAVIVSMGGASTQVCLAENGQLSNAVTLDMGIEDFAASGDDEQTEADETVALDLGISSVSVRPHEGQTEITERFAQDMRSVVEMFGCADQAEIPVFVLSDDSVFYVSIVSALRSADLNARVALPEAKKLTGRGESGLEWIYQYRAPIGLAMLATEEQDGALDIFRNVYRPAGSQKKRHWLYSPKVACAIVMVMLALLAAVSYAIDLKSPKAIKTRIEASITETDMDLEGLVERQRLIKTVARERPDMLALLKVVNSGGERGVMLNSLNFKKDQKVTITGQVQSSDQLYKLQQNLRKNKDIEEVKIQSTAKVSGSSSSRSSGPRPPSGPSPGGGPSARPSGPGGAKGKGGITFTITFHYKNFTKKTTRTAG